MPTRAPELDRLTAAAALAEVRELLAQHQERVLHPAYVATGPVGLCSDLHLPLMDADLFAQLLGALERHRCREAALVGDLFDQEAFSSHPPGLRTPSADFQVELELARRTLLALLAHVDRLYLLPGNHDVRVLRVLKYQLGMLDLVRVILPEAGLLRGGTGTVRVAGKDRELVVSRLPRLELRVYDQPWVLLHPASYSKVRGRTATLFADQEASHVAIGHVHHFHQGLSTNGRWHALELGGLFNPKLLSYVHEGPKPGTAMTQGFFILGPEGPIGYSPDPGGES